MLRAGITYLLVLFVAIKTSSACHDAFVNVTAKVKPFQKTEPYTVTINGCIERVQDAFNSKIIETIEVENQIQKTIAKDSVRHMTRLKFLRFDNCSMESIHPMAFRNLVRIHEIMIRRNNIREIEGGTFARDMPLASLDLSGNHIQVIKGEGFSNMPSLRKLRLNANELTELDSSWFVNTDALEILHTDHNKITKISAKTFTNKPKLRDVHLEFNEISVIEPNAFENVNKLAYLNLRYNKLTTFNADAFPGNHVSIGKLYLSANWINFLPQKLMDKLDVGLVTLDGNPMLCNCLDSVRVWLQRINSTLTVWAGCGDDSLPICVFPKVFGYKCIENVDVESSKDYFDKLQKNKINSLCARLDYKP